MANADLTVYVALDTAMREYLMAERQALLLRLEAIEKLVGISPLTSEIRKAAKNKAYNEAEKKGEQ